MDRKTELFEKLTKLQWLMQKSSYRGRAAGGPMGDVSRGQGRILAFLKMKDGISTRDLSYLLGIRISSLNELLAKLEKNGYIVREQSETDKRIILIKLTEKGREEQPEINKADIIFDCLSEAEQSLFGEYLDRIISSLELTIGDGVKEEYEKAMNRREETFEKFFNGDNPLESLGRKLHEGLQGQFGGFGNFGASMHFNGKRYDDDVDFSNESDCESESNSSDNCNNSNNSNDSNDNDNDVEG